MTKSKAMKGLMLKNKHGGCYHPGKQCNHVKKMMVGAIYRKRCANSHPDKPSIRSFAKEAEVSRYCARKVIKELQETEELMDPEEEREYWQNMQGVGVKCLTKFVETVLFALWCEASERSNLSHTHGLFVITGTSVLSSFISQWFLKAFPNKGFFQKPNQIPINKFRTPNIIRMHEYQNIMQQFILDHTRLNFLDEKHIVDKDSLPKKVRANVWTSFTPFLFLSQDFCEAFNIFAIVSLNPNKAKPMGLDFFLHLGVGGHKHRVDATIFFVCGLQVLLMLGRRFLVCDQSGVARRSSSIRPNGPENLGGCTSPPPRLVRYRIVALTPIPPLHRQKEGWERYPHFRSP